MESISDELKRAVKGWLRRHKKWTVSNSQLSFLWRLDHDAERVCRAGRGYPVNLIFNFGDDCVVLIWKPMWLRHTIHHVGRSIIK